jgi:hypothetical protein
MQFKAGLKVLALALVLVASLMGTARAAVTIDTTPSWNFPNAVEPFGSPNTATYGEVVTAPGSTLQSFTFYMNQSSFNFGGYVYAWNGTQATGPQLWASGPMATAGSGTYEAITFNPNVSVTSGSQYVLFASVSDAAYYGGGGRGYWGYIGSNSGYPGTYFVFYNNGNNFSALTTSQWDSTVFWGTGDALAFKAQFGSAVPIPGALLLFGPGLAGLAVVRRRFKK